MYQIAIIGRPNVGKSTLFNKLVGRRKSIVEPTPGITRDVNEEVFTMKKQRVMIYDTGGLVDKSNDVLNEKVQARSVAKAKSADLIIFMVDVNDFNPADEHYGRMIKKLGKPVLLVINKADNDTRAQSAYEFDRLGFPNKLVISAEHSVGLADLAEAIEAHLPDVAEADEVAETEGRPTDEVNIAIVGKPNTGKSTLLNTLVGDDRSIVSDIAGTTRDPVDSLIEFKGKHVRLVDTAGIRKKKRVAEDVEYYSVNRAIKVIESCDVAILLIDITDGFTDQDKKIASLIVDRRRGLVIGVNKWDKHPADVSWADYEAYLRKELQVAPYAIITKLSGMKKKDADQIMSLALRVAAVRETKLETHELTELLHGATKRYSVTAGKTTFKVFYVVQTDIKPPTFLLFCNHPDTIAMHYRRYLENRLREVYDFRGTPIEMRYKKRREEKR